MDIQVENVPVDPTKAAPVTAVETTSPVEHLSIASRFNIDTPTKEEDAKLSTIWSYVKQQGSERSIPDIIWDVINLEQTIGSPRLGETRLDKLYRYVNLRIQESRIQSELQDATSSLNIYR